MIWQIDKLENFTYNINWFGYLAYFLMLDMLMIYQTYQWYLSVFHLKYRVSEINLKKHFSGIRLKEEFAGTECLFKLITNEKVINRISV